MDNICKRCYHNYVCDEYNADRDFPHKVCAYHNSHFIDAADVVEVRHGRWIGLEYDGYADGCPVYDLWECSECGEEVRGEDVPNTHPWCHSCGARMDKEDEHEAD